MLLASVKSEGKREKHSAESVRGEFFCRGLGDLGELGAADVRSPGALHHACGE